MFDLSRIFFRGLIEDLAATRGLVAQLSTSLILMRDQMSKALDNLNAAVATITADTNAMTSATSALLAVEGALTTALAEVQSSNDLTDDQIKPLTDAIAAAAAVRPALAAAIVAATPAAPPAATTTG